MKKTVRSAILMVGLAGIFLSAAVPQVAALDGGMIIKKPVTCLDGGVIIKKPRPTRRATDEQYLTGITSVVARSPK